MADKVIGGTPISTENKCNTCRYAVRMRGTNLQDYVHCQYLGRRVPFQLESCSVYDDKRLPALHEMREIAWNIETRNRGHMGFVNGADLEIEITPPRKRDDNTQNPPHCPRRGSRLEFLKGEMKWQQWSFVETLQQ